jgi:hypothetical protein
MQYKGRQNSGWNAAIMRLKGIQKVYKRHTKGGSHVYKRHTRCFDKTFEKPGEVLVFINAFVLEHKNAMVQKLFFTRSTDWGSIYFGRRC